MQLAKAIDDPQPRSDRVHEAHVTRAIRTTRPIPRPRRSGRIVAPMPRSPLTVASSPRSGRLRSAAAHQRRSSVAIAMAQRAPACEGKAIMPGAADRRPRPGFQARRVWEPYDSSELRAGTPAGAIAWPRLSGCSRDPTAGETTARSRMEQSVDLGGALLQPDKEQWSAPCQRRPGRTSPASPNQSHRPDGSKSKSSRAGRPLQKGASRARWISSVCWS